MTTFSHSAILEGHWGQVSTLYSPTSSWTVFLSKRGRIGSGSLLDFALRNQPICLIKHSGLNLPAGRMQSRAMLPVLTLRYIPGQRRGEERPPPLPSVS